MNKAKHICASIARTLLGLTFIFSGFVKAVDPLGTTYKIEDYLKAFDGLFMQLLPLAETAALCLITFEFVLGICLLLNVRTNITAWLALLMMLVMTPLTLYIAIENPVTDCGCFGDAVVLSNWATFWKNIILLALVILLLCWKRYIPDTFTWKAEAAIAVIAIVAVCGVMAHSLTHLPAIDFRPYKVGNYLPELMQPDADDPEAEAPVHDFEFTDLTTGDDLTDMLLEADNATLVVMYDLKKSDADQLQKVIRLAQVEQQNNHLFCIATGSWSGEVDEFLHSQIAPLCTNPDDFEVVQQAFCSADPIMLKTIVRANPGVMVLREGTVADKYNLANRRIEQIEALRENNAETDAEDYVYEYDGDTPLENDFTDSDVYTDEQDFE